MESGRGSGAIHQKSATTNILLCEKETLLGERRECVRLELTLMDDFALQGICRWPHQAPGLYNHAVCKCAMACLPRVPA